MKELFNFGFGMHHAGMLRSDRTLTERMFADGILKVKKEIVIDLIIMVIVIYDLND